MKSTNVVLLGIAIILFGGVCLAVNAVMEIGEFFEVLSIFSPFVGLAIAFIGAFSKD